MPVNASMDSQMLWEKRRLVEGADTSHKFLSSVRFKTKSLETRNAIFGDIQVSDAIFFVHLCSVGCGLVSHLLFAPTPHFCISGSHGRSLSCESTSLFSFLWNGFNISNQARLVNLRPDASRRTLACNYFGFWAGLVTRQLRRHPVISFSFHPVL